MRPSTRATRTLALGLLATALLGASTGAAAADPVTTTLVPIGSDYQADTLFPRYAKYQLDRTRAAEAAARAAEADAKVARLGNLFDHPNVARLKSVRRPPDRVMIPHQW